MKIAIDSGPLTSGHSVRGVGVYTRELLNALGMEGVDVRSEDLDRYDIVHFTSFKPYEISLPFYKPKHTRFVLTIYDLIPLIYSEHYPSGIKGLLNWHINKYLIRNHVSAIITISETSKKDICRFLSIDPEKIFVTRLAPRSIFKKITSASLPYSNEVKHKLPRKFALYVGDVNYNKNAPNLVKACKMAGIPLVIAGKQAAEVGDMDLDHPELKHLKNIDWTGVIRLGFVSDEDLVKIYNLASVYVQPSFYEGFGLPLLEGWACGTPIAVSNNQCHVEILGSDFDYFDPKDPESIARAILNPNRNKKLPREYSWKKVAKATLTAYAKI